MKCLAYCNCLHTNTNIKQTSVSNTNILTKQSVIQPIVILLNVVWPNNEICGWCWWLFFFTYFDSFKSDKWSLYLKKVSKKMKNEIREQYSQFFIFFLTYERVQQARASN
jgi:hypothetical protein